VKCRQARFLRTQSHNGWVLWVDCSPDVQAVTSGSADQTIRLWISQRESRSKHCTGQASMEFEPFYLPDRRTPLVVMKARPWLWISTRGTPSSNLARRRDCAIWAIAFSSTYPGQYGEEQTAKLWDVQTGRCLKLLKGHGVWGAISCLYQMIKRRNLCVDCLVRLGTFQQEMLPGHAGA